MVAAAIAGVTPEYGLHLKENRYGKVLVDLSGLNPSSLSLTEYSAIGSYIGRTLVDKTPVIVGLPPTMTQDQIRFLISPMPTAGAISLCHIVGITPEAPSVEAALQTPTLPGPVPGAGQTPDPPQPRHRREQPAAVSPAPGW